MNMFWWISLNCWLHKWNSLLMLHIQLIIKKENLAQGWSNARLYSHCIKLICKILTHLKYSYGTCLRSKSFYVHWNEPPFINLIHGAVASCWAYKILKDRKLQLFEGTVKKIRPGSGNIRFYLFCSKSL